MIFEIEKVIEEIEKLVKLPKTGFLTGQAFSSLILKYNGFNKYRKKPAELIINDIDIFIKVESNTFNFNREKEEDEYEESYSKRLNYELLDGYRQFLEGNKEQYGIIASYEIDKLNITKVVTQEKEFEMGILKSFDYNNVQIGIDLETKKVFYTKDFMKFFKTGQLEMVNLHSAAISLCRGIRKSREQGLYFNEEKEVHKVGVYNTLNRWYFFGEKNKNKYVNELDYLKDKFKIKEIKFKDLPEELDRLRHEETQKARLYILEPLLDYSKEKEFFEKCMILRKRKENILRINELFFGNKRKEIETYLNYFKNDNEVSTTYNVFAYVRGGKLKEKAVIKKYLTEKYHKEKGFSINKINEIAKNISMHTYELFGFFVYNVSSYSETLKMYEIIRKTIKKYGQTAVSTIERYCHGQNVNEINVYELYKEVDSYIESLKNEVYKEREFEVFEKDDFIFKELVTGYEISEEGAKMNHCVGGYGHSIEQGYCLIYSVEHKYDRKLNMTAEIRKNNLMEETHHGICYYKRTTEYLYRLAQLMHHSNRAATNDFREFVTKTLLTKLNNEDYSKKLSDFTETVKKGKVIEDMNQRDEYFKSHGINVEDEIPF